MKEHRCECHKLLMKDGEIKCPRCKKINVINGEVGKVVFMSDEYAKKAGYILKEEAYDKAKKIITEYDCGLWEMSCYKPLCDSFKKAFGQEEKTQ